MGASSGSTPNRLERRCTMVRNGPIATSKAPMEAIPVGPENKVSAPMMQAIATGSSRLVATARSTEHQVSRIPRAMIGSGRRPLSGGSQTGTKHPGAGAGGGRAPGGGPALLDGVSQTGHDFAADRPPAGQRHYQGGQPHPDAGGADMGPQGQQVVVPAERRLGRAEPA